MKCTCGKQAETTDGKLCKKCLRQLLKEMSPEGERDLSRRGTEYIGRSHLDTKAQEGACDFEPDPEFSDDEPLVWRQGWQGKL